MMNKEKLIEIHRKLMDTRRLISQEGEKPERGTPDLEIYEGITAAVGTVTRRLRDIEDRGMNLDLFPSDTNEREL